MKSARLYGLGLMGTNLGLKLLSKGVTVYGEDVDRESLDRASSLGIKTSNTSEVVDLTILAMPINNIISTLSSEKLMHIVHYITLFSLLSCTYICKKEKSRQ